MRGPQPSLRRVPLWGWRVALVFAGTAAGLLVAELFARFAYRGPVMTSSFTVPDSELGFRLRRNADGEEIKGEFRVHYRIDGRLGVRIGDDGRAPTLPPDLVLYGDSFVFGYAVPDDACFASLLAAQWPSRNVLNAGVFHYGPDAEFLWARSLRHELGGAPEVVFFFEGNDFEDLGRYPLVTVGTDGSPTARRLGSDAFSWRQRLTRLPAYPWLCKLYLWQWVRAAWLQPADSRAGGATVPASPAPGAPERAAQCAAIFAAWQREAGQGRLLVVLVPWKYRFRGSHPLLPVLRRELAARGVPCFDLFDEARQQGLTAAAFRSYYYRRDFHWTPAGHRWAARVLEPRLATFLAGVAADQRE